MDRALLRPHLAFIVALAACGGRSVSDLGADEGASGGTGARSCPTDVAELFPPSGASGSLDGFLVTAPCEADDDVVCEPLGWVHDGATLGCSRGSPTFQADYAVGGVRGAAYRATLHFYGIVELKDYGASVVRESGERLPANFDTGAEPAPFGLATSAPFGEVPASDASTYELHVLDEALNETAMYVPNSGRAEAPVTYVLDFEETIAVVGGGRVRVRSYDRNCRIAKNCGPDPTSPCAPGARSVDVSKAEPPPDALDQPGLGVDAQNAGQWLFIDVVGVGCGS